MNSKHILDLTFRLSQALDKDYDVVNMGAVMSVISALESTTITKEQLETTRLGKSMNQLRRRTKSEHLARRAKSLLKKWREMLGIQQPHEPLSSNAATMINDNSIATYLHQPKHPQLQNQQHHHRSQPTSPIIDINLENVHANQKTNIIHADFMRSTVSNPVTSLTRSANLSIYSSNKRLENIECQSGGATAASSSTVPTSGCGTQPTSFANLISFGNIDNSISKNIGNAIAGLRVASPRAIRKSNKIPERDIKLTETFIIDQSSNSNSEFGYTPSNKSTCAAPIVIDIQDSNSGPNLITSIITNKLEMETPASSSKVPTSVNSVAMMPFKSKKVKKEKKHKETETLNEIIPYSSTSLLVADESFSNQHRQINIEDGKLASAVQNKSRLKFPYNISEILSLSNCSMSSLFPTEGGTSKTVSEKKTKLEIKASNRTLPTNLSTSDLTFAGKFKHHNSTMPSILSQNNTIGFNGSDTSRIDSSNVAILGPPDPEKNVLNKFVPFSGSACNSNDSTSNSRTFQFDVIDVISQEKQSNTGSVYVQSKSTAENLIMPPGVSTTQQTAETTGTNRNVIVQDKKIPKKRGRKKGSKGVDSVIAKETSLSSQMLISSLGGGGKKVKTTKELYTELHNRNLGISTNTSSPTLANWASRQQLSSRPESSCSEPSLHSPRTLDACSTNATMSTVATRSTPEKYLTTTYIDESDSDTITSDPSRDSISAQKKIKKGASIDSNSNLQFPASKVNEYKKNLTHATGTIERQLLELLKQLPPVPKITNIEGECAREIVPCTCQIMEILPDLAETQGEETSSSQNIPSTDYETKIEETEQQPAISVNVIEQGTDKPKITAPKSVPAKPIKSIFDLDFDDDEDPLHTLMAEAAAASAKLEESNEDRDISALEKDIVDTKSDLVVNSDVHPVEFVHKNISPKQMIPLPSSVQPMPIFVTYEVNEDDNCMAKQRFEIQTQKITKFHIYALHNCFIPNVNGNWDNADIQNKGLLDSDIDMAADLPSIIDNGYNVVPKYGSLVNERIRKDLSHVSFTKDFKPKKQSVATENMYSTPFLGVASRCQLQRKHRKHKLSNCDKRNTIVKDENKKTVENNEELELHMNSSNEVVHACEDKDSDIDDKSVVHTNRMGTSLNNITNLNPQNTMTTNNMLLNGITIDVSVSNVIAIHAEDGRNLLAIADSYTETPPIDILSSKEMDITNAGLSTLHKTESRENCTEDCNTTKIVCVDKSIPASKASDTSTKVLVENSGESANFSDANTVAYFSTRIDENTSSRRSSSCSNSSLKQTQQSINVKLRRQRLLQQQQEPNFVDGANGRKRRHKKDNNKHCYESDSELQERKEVRDVKRIKISINGDVTTQHQIFFGSSDNSTEDDDAASKRYEHDELNDNIGGSLNSAGSHNSTFEDDDFNIANNDDEEINQICDENDEQESEEYEDADYYEDDEENYSCDHHEVITRDMSSTSTGNNHIVLTIKKTPSKTNSPSNSLSAMSPVITSSTNTTNNALPAVSKTVTQNLSAGDIIKIVEKCEQVEAKSNDCLQCEIINAPADNYDESKGQFQPCETFSPISPVDNISNNMLPVLQPPHYLEIKRKQRKRIKAKKTKAGLFPEEHTAEKLHRKLFFSYELPADMINTSSCSSSCTEKGNDEYDTNDYATKNNQSESFSEMLQSLSNSKYRKRNLSKSDSSSCDSSNTAQKWKVPYFTNATYNSEKRVECKASLACQNYGVNSLEFQSMKQDIEGGTSDKNKCNLNGRTAGEVKSEPSDEFEQSTDQRELPFENNGLLLSFNNIHYNVSEKKLSSSHESVDRFNKVVAMTDNDDGTLYDANVIHWPAEDEEKMKKQLQKKNCDDNNLYNNNNNLNLTKYDSNEPSLKNIDSFRISCRNNSGINSFEANFVDYEKLTNIDATVKYNNKLPKINNYIDDKQPTPSTSCSTAITLLASTAPPPRPPQFLTRAQQLLPYREYRTGLRAVDEDVDDDDGNNCARIQQFKEWHQVLQLRSYNDEMLTVLPYVVLE